MNNGRGATAKRQIAGFQKYDPECLMKLMRITKQIHILPHCKFLSYKDLMRHDEGSVAAMIVYKQGIGIAFSYT